MHIEHIAIWTQHLEALKAFYETCFSAQSSPKYTNPTTGFQSYFLTFAAGARLELMQAPDVAPAPPGARNAGYAHIALVVGSWEQVDHLTHRLEAAGYRIAGQPRTTGDGYYESVILDPDGNRIEITAETTQRP
ncbi:MAG: VOC family protein [Anaerolineae bacterium]|jgi:lactoylglutathione lyase|nr:VOC family protein [Anaerolineae bacterium]